MKVNNLSNSLFFNKETNIRNDIRNKSYKVAFCGSLERDVFEIKGTKTAAKIYTKNINGATVKQIEKLCSHPVFKNTPIRIMPDTCPSRKSVVGFTAPIDYNNGVAPDIIGGDIGCGMLCCEIDTFGKDVDFKKLDKIIKETCAPAKQKTINHDEIGSAEKEIADICDSKLDAPVEDILKGIGTLGSGNHFIEVGVNQNNKIFLVIHTGSRNFGQKIFNYHKNIAEKQNPCPDLNLPYLTGEHAKQYIEDLKLAQKYAKKNRASIANKIVNAMGWRIVSSFESVHNYIGEDDVIRKGAISAQRGEKVIIPINMRDGSLIAIGKGNKEWNYSAPHGAGRILSRKDAKEKINIEDYKNSMQGIYTTCITKNTIDESPQAYRGIEEIEENTKDTITIKDRIKPVYNFKNS